MELVGEGGGLAAVGSGCTGAMAVVGKGDSESREGWGEALVGYLGMHCMMRRDNVRRDEK